MLRDPFYRQILQALEGLGQDKAQVFQRCMGDLLRGDFPWIVPMAGGPDSGMDGAIADREGEPLPLVCTVREDVIGNLTYSLDSYLTNRGPRRKVVLATSRRLTNRQKGNLYKRAREKRFKLLQVFDQEPIADRLFNNRRWCEELLGLTWKASLLSVVPATRRPLIEIEPVGRDKDLDWIEKTQGDRVLYGEPGSGKTFLFHHLIRKRAWPGLFLIGRDLDGFCDAWLEQQPKIVVVDDAHDDPELLVRLVRLRQEMKASFEIAATTWKGGREVVMEALGVPAPQVRKLDLLTRDEILDVIRAVGVQESDEIMRDLVSQAANKPGLAVTIASLWLQGSWEEVLSGQALSRSLTMFFHRFLGTRSTDVLACLALGGNRGVASEAVREFLELSRPDMREITSGLAAGGVLSEVDRDTLTVWPRNLRFALLRSVFFPGTPAPLPYRRLLDLVPSREKAIETIVAARHHGAEIPDQELRALVAEAGSLEAWRGMALLGKAEALWVLERYPGDVIDVAGAALHKAGEAAILRLLQRAETASGHPHSRLDHPIRILQDWVQELDPNIPLDEMVRRRKLLAKISREYLRAGGLRSVGLQGICLALSPALEGSSSDPGAGRTVTVRWGLLPAEQLQEVASIWTKVREDLGWIEAEDWQHLSAVLWNWVHPTYASKGRPVSEDIEGFMRDFAATVLRDLAPAAQGKPGLTAKMRELAQKIGLELCLEPDPIFDLLFPSMEVFYDETGGKEAEWRSALEELSSQWGSRDPAKIAELLAMYEREAQRIGRNSLDGCLEVCRRLAIKVNDPEAWVDALLAQHASGSLTGPFLERILAARQGQEGWERQAERFLAIDRQHAWSVVESILRHPSPPPHLLKRALGRLNELPQLLEGLCRQRRIPVETLRSLLHDRRPEISLTAAVSEWGADKQGGVRPEVAADWRLAILHTRVDGVSSKRLNPSIQHLLGVILAKDPDLALAWLTARLRDAERVRFIAGDDPFGLALSALKKEQRLQLVKELEKGRAPTGFVGLLVGKDRDVFEQVLFSEALRSHHLEPLGFLPDANWMELAVMVLKADHELDDVVGASLWPQVPGTGLEHWQQHERAFAEFEADPRAQVQELARRGQQLAAEEGQEAEKRERQFAIHGRFV